MLSKPRYEAKPIVDLASKKPTALHGIFDTFTQTFVAFEGPFPKDQAAIKAAARLNAAYERAIR